MATSSYNKVNDFVEYVGSTINLKTDTPKLALSDTAPGSETNDPTADGNGILANVTQIDYTNYSDNNSNDQSLTVTSATQSGGTLNYILADITITASGGDLGPFRYIYIYDETVTDDPLIGYYDYGSSITLGDGESLQIDLDNSSGTFTIA